jgi:hypothetical protein
MEKFVENHLQSITQKNEIKEDKKIYDKEAIRNKNKLFFEKNKDRKYYCETCMCEFSFFNKAHHKESKRHLDMLEKEKYKQMLEEQKHYIKQLEEKTKNA